MEAARIKLVLIYILNVTDMLFTRFLLSTGYFAEANPLMKSVMGSGFFSVVFKVVLPLFLLGFLGFRLRKASARQLETADRVLGLCMLGYFAVNGSHIIWTTMFFLLG